MARLYPANQNLLKNKLLRNFLLLHEKHTILLASSDYTTVKNDKLVDDYSNAVLMDLAGFTYIDNYTQAG